MDNKLRTSGAILAGAVVAMATPCLAWALGLGQIQSNTRIGQNFQARIPILAASNADVQGLDVGLASPAAYKQAGVSEPDYLFGLKFAVKQGANGPYVLVTSDKPVRLPFLNLLVHASWSSGEVTRQYTVLLNPPVFAAGTSRQPVSAPSSPAQQPAQQPQSQQPAQPPQAQPVQPSPQTAPATQPVHSYGPVQHGATLWGLARKLRPDNSVTVNQMMVALYKENPHAFSGNINRLKAGYVLKVPSRGRIENLSAAAATREVASQNRAWQASRGQSSAQQSRVAAAQATASQPEAAKAGAGSQSASAAAGSGRVLLTTPKVTAAQGAVAPGTVASGKVASGKVAQAAGAGSSAGSAQVAAAAATSGSMAGTGASAGGPAKVRSNAMANLAAGAASTGSQAAAAKQSAAAAAKQSGAATNNANSVNNANTVNTVNTGAAGENGAGWESWVTEPRGWAIIGGVILLLAALILLLLQRRRSTAAVLEEASREGEPGAGEEFGAGMEEAAEGDTAAGGDAEPHAEGDRDFGAETYIGGPAATLDEPDPVAEADFHAGYGEYGEAARILREAIGREPERNELRRKLLDTLFAAGDAEAFETEAAEDRDVFGQESDDWREIAAMGRQLRPDSKLFDADAGGSEPAAGGAGSSDSLDFDMDLDRLSGTESTEGGQDEFERTMDELSTFIETYIPGSGDAPLNLQLPPEETSGRQGEERPAEDAADADEPIEFDAGDSEPAETPEERQRTGTPTATDELEPIEFEPELQAESGITESTDAGYGEEVDEGGAEVGGENLIDTKLDLARAYLDMDDPESARGVLEEVLDEGDEKQRSEAQRLLETLA